MLRYDRQSKPGLVALYDIRPWNGVGPFLQPWSPHGAMLLQKSKHLEIDWINGWLCICWILVDSIQADNFNSTNVLGIQ